MTLDEFEQAVFRVAGESAICEVPTVRALTPTSQSIRVPLTIGGYVDAFFNEVTGTTAFALIQNDARILGADNTGGWHLHPFGDPEKHQRMNDGMSFSEFVAAIEKRFSGER